MNHRAIILRANPNNSLHLPFLQTNRSQITLTYSYIRPGPLSVVGQKSLFVIWQWHKHEGPKYETLITAAALRWRRPLEAAMESHGILGGNNLLMRGNSVTSRVFSRYLVLVYSQEWWTLGLGIGLLMCVDIPHNGIAIMQLTWDVEKINVARTRTVLAFWKTSQELWFQWPWQYELPNDIKNLKQ